MILGAHAVRTDGGASLQDLTTGTMDASSSRECGADRGGGRTKALLVGFEYGGKIGGTLKGTCYDMYNMVRWAKQQGYSNISYFTDKCHTGQAVIGEDWSVATPLLERKAKVTKEGLRAAFAWLVDDACPGDSLLFHYTGHGTFVQYEAKDRKKGQDECNGKDEALYLPIAFNKAWGWDKYADKVYYTDDELFTDLVARVPARAHLFAIVDACHSGTVLDLPWNWMSQKYYWSCPHNADQRKYTDSQFVWEWAKPPEKLGRTYPLDGTVTLITGSQNTQTSGDGVMTQVRDANGVLQNVGGLMTYRLILDHADHANPRQLNPPILDTAMKEKWSWAKTIAELVKQVAGSEELVTSKNKQIPNFGASHRLDMSKAFSLDNSAFAGPPSSSDPASASKLQCDTGAWMREKRKLKAPGCA